MTEQEWNESSDPVAMLRHLTHADARDHDAIGQDLPPLASDRKLRLFHEAALKCDDFDFARDIHWTPCPGGHGRRLTAIVVWSGDRLKGEQYHHFALDTDAGSVAHILRDIIGNPWRPVTLPLGEVCGACEGSPVKGKYTPDGMGLNWLPCSCCHGTGHGPSPVLTPLVLSIAQAAYTDRDRKCLACNQWTDCKWCNNTRRVARTDGTLDDATLAILADALEDAGMPGEVECDRPGVVMSFTGMMPHPLLAALRSPGPHHPGFWALDVVMGEGVMETIPRSWNAWRGCLSGSSLLAGRTFDGDSVYVSINPSRDSQYWHVALPQCIHVHPRMYNAFDFPDYRPDIRELCIECFGESGLPPFMFIDRFLELIGR